jgi:MoxR-like ATPase
MRGAVVGRDAAFDQAWRSLYDTRAGLVDGPAGIGKTALFRALVAEAERTGWLVLSCAPVESEVDLPFVSLGARS